jgi:hypothetical protein
MAVPTTTAPAEAALIAERRLIRSMFVLLVNRTLVKAAVAL